MQELLHHRLRAEAELNLRGIILKLYQRGECTKDKPRPNATGMLRPSQVESDQKKGERKSNKATADMGIKVIKCYKCHKEGHIVRLCPEANIISMGSGLGSLCEGQSSDSIPWIRVLTVLGTTTVDEEVGAKLSGPTYMIDIQVEEVKTRALLDSGSQVTLVRAELLPLIEQNNGWAPSK